MHRMHFIIHELKNRVKKWNKRETESGQSIVILVLGLIGLLAFAGLVFDGGSAYAQYRRMQNAADAGALAGAQELSKKNTIDGTTNGTICATVLNYAHSKNAQVKYSDWQTDADVQVQYILNDPNPYNKLKGVPGCHVGSPANPSGPPPDNAQGIRVTVSTTFKTFFLGLMGVGAGTSTAHASAEYGPASPINVQPLAKRCPDTIPPCDLRIGIYQEIWQSDEPGNLGWLAFNGDTSARNMRDEFNPNLPPVPYVDDMTSVDGVPRIPCTTIGLDCWVQGKPGVSDTLKDTLDEYWAKSPRPLIIVLYDRETETGSNTEFHIVGFAAFMLDKFDLSGATLGKKSMWGTFVRWMDSAAICKDCADTGLYSVHLIPDVVEPPPPPETKGRICVTVAYDVATNGTFEASEDYYLAGATVKIWQGSTLKDSWVTQGISTNCTDAVFDPGTYTVIETNPSGYTSVPNVPSAGQEDIRSVLVTAGGTADVLFLDYYTTVGNVVVLTRDYDGAVLPTLSASLKLASDLSLRGGPSTSITGTVYFRNRPAGNYIVVGGPPPGYDMVDPPPKIYDNIPVTVTVGTTTTVTLVAKKYPSASICVEVWDDGGTDPPNGKRDAGEKSLWGAIITVAGTENRTHTMGDGEYTYCFDNLRLGPYTVTQSHPPGYSSAPGSVDSRALVLAGNITYQFFDIVPPRGNLCVEVFDDVTGDGLATPGEKDIAGGKIDIYRLDGQPPPPPGGQLVATYTTNGTEPKCFSLLVGYYKVQETSNPPGYLSTNPDIRDNVSVLKDSAITIQFADRASLPTATPTRTRTPTPTITNTPLPNTTPTPTPTQTLTPIPGNLWVRVYNDTNGNGIWDATPPPTPLPPATPDPFTPEPTLAPRDVTVQDAIGNTVASWNGSGTQPHQFANLPPGDYSAIETDPFGYASTTAQSVTVAVTSGNDSYVEFGDKLCFAVAPTMYDPIFQSGTNWWLHWNDVPGTYYTVYGSNDSIDPTVGTWNKVADVAGINYVVAKGNDGVYFYVVATDNCGRSGPSNVVALQ